MASLYVSTESERAIDRGESKYGGFEHLRENKYEGRRKEEGESAEVRLYIEEMSSKFKVGLTRGSSLPWFSLSRLAKSHSGYSTKAWQQEHPESFALVAAAVCAAAEGDVAHTYSAEECSCSSTS
jgi:hypothetical protein